MKLKLYTIAAAFGDPATNVLAQTVTGTWFAASAEVATAQFCSKFYYDGGARHALIGITAQEVTPDQLRMALETIEKAEQEPPKAVPFSVVQPAVPAVTCCPIHGYGLPCAACAAPQASPDPA